MNHIRQNVILPAANHFYIALGSFLVKISSVDIFTNVFKAAILSKSNMAATYTDKLNLYDFLYE